MNECMNDLISANVKYVEKVCLLVTFHSFTLFSVQHPASDLSRS